MPLNNLFFALWWGWVSRMIGGGFPSKYIPIALQWVYAVPYGAIFTGSAWGLIPYIAAALGKRTATYPYFLMGNTISVDASRRPPLDFIIRFFFGPISPTGGQYWRSAAGLGLEGLATTLAAGIAYAALINPSQGLLIAASGVVRGPAYMIELFCFKRGIISQQAVLGEFLDGFLAMGCLCLIS